MTSPFSNLDDLSLQQKQQLLMLISSIISAAEAKQQVAHSQGGKAQKLTVLKDSIGLVKLKHEINDNREALERSPTISTSSLLEPVLRYIDQE